MENNLGERQILNLTSSTTNDPHRDNNFTITHNNNDGAEPIDLQFKDITYTVNLGFNKGNFGEFLYYVMIGRVIVQLMTLLCPL